MNTVIIEYYITAKGKAPFEEWLEELDKVTRASVLSRLLGLW